MTIEIKVPDIGDFDGVEIIEVLVKAGDTVAAEQSIITVESDKASMEIPCPQAGVVKEMKVKIGDKVKEGTLMLILEPAAGGAAAGDRAQGRGGDPGVRGRAGADAAACHRAAAGQRPTRGRAGLPQQPDGGERRRPVSAIPAPASAG